MALSDCPKCWNTPCTCGYSWETNYSLFTSEEIQSLITLLQKMLDDRARTAKEMRDRAQKGKVTS